MSTHPPPRVAREISVDHHTHTHTHSREDTRLTNECECGKPSSITHTHTPELPHSQIRLRSASKKATHT